MATGGRPGLVRLVVIGLRAGVATPCLDFFTRGTLVRREACDRGREGASAAAEPVATNAMIAVTTTPRIRILESLRTEATFLQVQ